MPKHEDSSVQLSPEQSNAIIEEKLSLLEPALVRARDAMLQLKEDISNGGFSIKKLFRRALQRVQ